MPFILKKLRNIRAVNHSPLPFFIRLNSDIKVQYLNRHECIRYQITDLTSIRQTTCLPTHSRRKTLEWSGINLRGIFHISVNIIYEWKMEVVTMQSYGLFLVIFLCFTWGFRATAGNIILPETPSQPVRYFMFLYN
jgi:hypothetical protein